MAGIAVTTTINGDEVDFVCHAEETLLDVLRDRLGLTGAKEGCGTGDCGACSVIMDGRVVCSCLVLGAEAEGKEIETVEGMAAGNKLHPLQEKFLEHAALQCGVCTPGFLMAAKALLARNPDPSEEEIRFGLAGNLCRCTGYDKIVRAVQDAATRDERSLTMTLGADFTGQKFKSVGTRPLRPDGVDKVTGRARYGADYNLPGQLVGQVLRSPHAHAKIKKIDTSKAEKLKGVKAVITAADLPDLTNGDSGMFDILDNCMARKTAFYDGHAVAAVAAVDARTAKEALKLIKVDYEVLPHVTDVDEAVKPKAPLLHKDMFTGGVEPKPKKPSNVANRSQYGHGDTEAGFKAGRLHHRAQLQDRADASGLYRAACLRGERQPRRDRRDVGVHARPLRLSPAMRRASGPGYLQAARDVVGDRRRLRRQDPCVGRAAGARPVAQGQPAGEAGDEPRRGVPRLRADQCYLG